MDQVVNSSAWWDQAFRESWGVNHGREQTYGFIHTLLANVPEVEFAYLAAHDLDILDWGCAFGEGASTLSETFPRSRVAGLDFSAVAVEEARKQYPACEFIHTPNGEIPRDFDAIFTSNCLEHFPAPLDVATTHMTRCRKLYVAMVPFEEREPLSGGHEFRFDLATFPDHLGDFVCLSRQPLDVPRLYWPGRQLLVVYGSPAYVRERSAEMEGSAIADVAATRVRLVNEERWRLADALVKSRQDLYDMWAVTLEKDVALARRSEELDKARREASDLQTLVQAKEEALASLQAQLMQSQ